MLFLDRKLGKLIYACVYLLNSESVACRNAVAVIAAVSVDHSLIGKLVLFLPYRVLQN